MRIVVLGAAGGVGRKAVELARERGHDVVAGGRTAPAVPAGVESLALDVRDAEGVRTALAGADGVLWCIGVTKRSGGDVGRVSLPHVVAALPAGARVVTVSGAGVTLEGDGKGLGARAVSALTRRFAKDLVEDKQGENDVLAASALVWTQVRPPRLVDKPGTGAYTLGTAAPGPSAKPVARADVALAMVELVGSQDWAGKAPFLTRAD